MARTSPTHRHETGQKMGEAPASCDCVCCEVAPTPSPLSLGRSIVAPPLFQPVYLPARRPLSFAPPPRDEFALVASAHGCACLQALSQCLLRMHHTVTPIS